MNLNPYEFEKAKDGDLFVKKGERLVAISKSELLKEEKTEIKKIAKLEQEIEVMDKYLTELKTRQIAHFITVFTLFELKAYKGEIEVSDESLLNLDEDVLENRVSVEQALEKHPYLKETFNKLYGKVGK